MTGPFGNDNQERGRIAELERRVKAAEETAHYATGVADLAMKHRDTAEHRAATAEARVRLASDLEQQLIDCQQNAAEESRNTFNAELRADKAEYALQEALAREAGKDAALIDARDNGLIYWEPNTERGHVTKAAMLSRIDQALSTTTPHPWGEVAALVEAGRLAVKRHVAHSDESYRDEEWYERRAMADANLDKACAAIIEKEKGDG